MSTNPVVKVLSIVTYISIILHVIVTIYLTFDARQKRGNNYRMVKSKASSFSSRYMGILGTVILAFIIIHLSNFWYKAKFTNEILNDPFGKKDIYSMVVDKFANIEHVVIYVLAMGAIFLHSLHGFTSGFQSLGIITSQSRKYFKLAGILYSLLIPLLFALIPIYLYLQLHK